MILFLMYLYLDKEIASQFKQPVSEFNDSEPRLKSAKNRIQLSAALA